MSKGSPEKYEDEHQSITKSSYFTEAPDISKMPSYKLLDTIKVADMEPFIETKKYSIAHGEANFWEQKKFPEGCKELEKLDDKLKENELVGANTLKGEIFVSKVVPYKYRQEVAYHEWVESLVRKEMTKK